MLFVYQLKSHLIILKTFSIYFPSTFWTDLRRANTHVYIQSTRVFVWGTGGPPGSKYFACPPQLTTVHAFWPECFPQLSFVLKNFKNFTFSLKFDYFLAQNCIRKLYFMLKTPNLL